MNVIIHRGTKEIGGTCIEIKAGGSRIVLDLGQPLTLPRDFSLPRTNSSQDVSFLKKENILPSVAGLYPGDDGPRPDALIISHPHVDHYGLVRFVDSSIPCVTGQASRRLMEISQKISPFSGNIPQGQGMVLENRKPITIGSFTVTPYLVGHSAFDAYALLVEAGGRRLFYSGDFRMHGRKGKLVERLLDDPPDVDVLLMEGTRISGRSDGFANEEELERELVSLLKRENSKLALATFSVQNVDRLVSFYKACRKAGRSLVVDPYTAYVLQEIQEFAKLPRIGWKGLRCIRTRRITRLMHRRGLSDFLDQLPGAGTIWQEMEANPGKYVLIFRDTMVEDMEQLNAIRSNRFILIFSLWSGYLRDTDAFRKYNDFARKHDIKPEHVHTSGHASQDDLVRFAQQLGKKRVVPIHSFAPEEFESLLEELNVTVQEDGIPFEA